MFKNLCPSALGVSGHQSEIIELALTYGFGGMDLHVADFATRVKLKGMPYARRLIDSAKIRIGTFPLPVEWEAPDEEFQKVVHKLSECAQVAAEVGCTRCVATLAAASDKRPYHENFEFHRRRLATICGALQPAGVRLAVGFQAAEYLRRNQAFQFIHDLDALTLLVNMIDAPNIGLLLDTWDLFACGGTIDTIRSLPPAQIVALQVADMPAEVPLADLGENSRLLPGGENGRIDIAGVLAALAAAGYQGPVTPKPSRSVFQSRRRDVIVKQAGEALDKVWRAAGLPSESRKLAAAAKDM
jgi:sugar phosphate isomerase/epimerase